MRASISLSSLFSSLRSQSIAVPAIRVTKSLDSTAPTCYGTSVGGIRRWRGALGTLGDFTLQLPSQGLTRGARLALARQGCATGSFRLNCAESLYAVDEYGRAMFQRIQLEEELRAAAFDLMERPPTRCTNNNSPEDTRSFPSTVAPGGFGLGRRIARRVTSDSGTSRNSAAVRPRRAISAQDMRFSASGLSGCATFTEGLSSLDTFLDIDLSANSDSGSQMPCSEISVSVSVRGVDFSTSPMKNIGGFSMSWFDSLKKRSRTVPHPGDAIKKKTSTSSLTRSLSCWELGPALIDKGQERVCADDSPSSSPAHKRGKVQRPLQIDGDISMATSASARQLPLDGSWSRLRSKFRKPNDMMPAKDGLTLHASTSVASGLYLITQQGVSVTQCSVFGRASDCRVG